MDIQEIINNIAAGENVAAKEGLENVLSAKAFDALQGYKQEIASALYAGQDEQPEEDTDYEEDEEEVAYAEGVEHDDEQLDERAKWRTSSIAHDTGYRKETDGYHGGIHNTADTGKEDLLKYRNLGIRSGTPLTKYDTKRLKKSITKNLAQMKK
jgi:hypothetical protein